MTDRIIDISSTGVFLKVENHLLVIKTKDGNKSTVPLKEIAALVISHPAVTLTHAVMAGLAEAGAIVIVSDGKHMPTSMTMPLNNNSVQSMRFSMQAEAAEPVKKRLWQYIVVSKIKNQAELLLDITGSSQGLEKIAARVKSGDSENREAHAARRYWSALDIFEKRERFAEDSNMFLNYGYSILHAMTARAICSSGLHPGLGVGHSNKYNPFCLASDLMEPFRPIVDKAAFELVKDEVPFELNRETKAKLLKNLTGRVILDNENVSIFNALSRLSASVARIFEGKAKKPVLPESVFAEEEQYGEEEET